MSNIDKRALRERYSPKPVPECHICGKEMTIQRMSASQITYGCTGATYDDKGCHYAEGRSIADDHYEQSRVTVVDMRDPDVLALLDELEAAEKRIAELDSCTVTVKLPNGDRDIAAFRIDPTEGPSWLTFRCEEDLRENGVIGEFDSVVPLSVITSDVPKRGEVVVTVSGLTGSGKSAIAGEIEIAMRAIGVPVHWMNGGAEKRMTGADWLTAIEMYKPTVRIVEVNVPRTAGIKVKG
ncbi:ead/Ea22-like family protein [Salmonella enterica subsp. salamae]|nr:ead/Ea22-like family protein [Salmonella enterica subsp. salamae serovar Sofia]